MLKKKVYNSIYCVCACVNCGPDTLSNRHRIDGSVTDTCETHATRTQSKKKNYVMKAHQTPNRSKVRRKQKLVKTCGSMRINTDRKKVATAS